MYSHAFLSLRTPSPATSLPELKSDKLQTLGKWRSNFTVTVTSACTQRVVLVLHELGVEYDFIAVALMKGEHKDTSYTQDVHPFGRIPTLKDGNFQLFESRAICRYLVSKFGGTSTLNSDKQADAVQIGTLEQAISIEYSYFDPQIKALCYENVFKGYLGKGAASPDEVEKATDILTTCLDYYEALLSKQDYLTGNEFGLVDIFVMPWLPWFHVLKMDDLISGRPKFESWWKRMTARRSWQLVQESLPKTG
ncbi:glutathione S-transferase [Cadophora sp. DSE1049]|nr:glutathione S-transferase [Cadophora sp. DSE1049]